MKTLIEELEKLKCKKTCKDNNGDDLIICITWSDAIDQAIAIVEKHLKDKKIVDAKEYEADMNELYDRSREEL